MLNIVNLVDKSIVGFVRKFKILLYGKFPNNMEQYHSGGDDYNPPANIKALSGQIGNNPRDGVVYLYQDQTDRKSAPGEKRIYSTDAEGKNITAEIHLKNNGDIVIIPKEGQKIITCGTIEHDGDITVSGTVTANTVIAQNGSSGTYSNSVIVENGIVTGGS